MANKGQFQKGHKGGPGRPSNGHAQLFKDLVMADIPDLVKSIVKDARGGCLASRRMIVDRIFPVASSQTMELEKQMEDIRDLVEAANDK